MTEKEKLRKIFLEKRSIISTEEVNEKSEGIYSYITDSIFYNQCKSIFVYVSMENEVNTKKIINRGLEDRKIIAVPKVNPKRKEMFFSQITSLDELQLGHFNVLEPKDELLRPLNSSKDTLILVPGVVFDKNKNRIGYGGGYYDRYLSSQNSILRIIGLGYYFQVIDQIPSHGYDIPLDTIITEKGWINS